MDNVKSLEEKELVWSSQVKVTLSRKQNLQPLRTLCLRKVTENLLLYANNGMTNIYNVLPSSLCSELFSEFVSCIHHYQSVFRNLETPDNLKVAYLFVDAKLNNFNDKILYEYSWEQTKLAEEQENFLTHLAAVAKNLKTLEFNTVTAGADYQMYLKVASSNLLTLKFGYKPIKREYLSSISEMCVSLQYLEMTFDSLITLDDVAPLTRMHSLKYFLYGVINLDNAEDVHEDIARFFLKEMPQLKINGILENVHCNYFAAHDLTVLKHPVELALEEINLIAYQIVPAHISLPHVTRLRVCAAESDVYNLTSFLHFPKLTSLSLTCFKFSQMKIMMQEYGKNLQILEINEAQDTCDLIEILQLCPKLHKLRVKGALVDINTIQLNKNNYFSLMKRVTIYFENHIFSTRGLLHFLLLHAPVLERIFLPKVKIDLDECSNITTDLKSGRACDYRLSILGLSCNQLFHDTTDGKEKFLNFVYQLCASCESLSTLCLFECHNSHEMETLLCPLKTTLKTFEKAIYIKVFSNKDFN